MVMNPPPAARTGHGAGAIVTFLAMNLTAVVVLSSPQHLPATLAAYVHTERMFLTLALLDVMFAIFVLPVFLIPAAQAGIGPVRGEETGGQDSSLPSPTGHAPLSAVFRRGPWATALYHAVILTLLALPFLALASRVAPLPSGTLAATTGCLLVVAADLALLGLLAGRWYYPIACGMAALPPLVDYLVLDVLGAASQNFTTLSPIGLLLATVQGGQLGAGGLSASRGALLYALLFVVMAVVAPVSRQTAGQTPAHGQSS